MTPGNSSPKASPASTEPTLFSAVITPHRSLGRRGFLVLMGFIGGLSFAAGIVFVAIGAWPVTGFLGLDVVLIYWAFRVNYGTGRAFEEVTMTPSELRVRQVTHRGQVSERCFHPAWTRLDRETHEDFGLLKLFLVSHGRRFVVAHFLSPDEREGFADALGAALGQARRGAP